MTMTNMLIEMAGDFSPSALRQIESAARMHYDIAVRYLDKCDHDERVACGEMLDTFDQLARAAGRMATLSDIHLSNVKS